MADRLTECPECGAELRATVARYLEGVELDAATGRIVAYGTWHGNDPDGFAWDHEATRVYCAGEDEHELTDWHAPHARPDGWALLGGFGTVPSPIGADVAAQVATVAEARPLTMDSCPSCPNPATEGVYCGGSRCRTVEAEASA